MAERTNALVLKTRGGKIPVGSNPTAPALCPTWRSGLDRPEYSLLKKRIVASEIAAPCELLGFPASGRSSTVRKGRWLLVKRDRKSTRLNSSHANISYAVFCLKKNT